MEVRENTDELAKCAGVAVDLCKAAELYKRLGDGIAQNVYEQAVEAAPSEPACQLFYGDCWLNFCGPMQPIVGWGETPFRGDARTGVCRPKQQLRPLCTVRNQLTRSIVALYERDGLTLYSWIAEPSACSAKGPGVSLFLSTGVRGGEGITDLDVYSNIRDFTSAAACSQLLRFTMGQLSTGLLRQFLRTVTPVDNRNRLRARYTTIRLDLFFNDRHAHNATITNSDLRDSNPLSNRDLVLYNALRINEFGVSFGDTFRLGATDADLDATYSRIS